MKFSDLFEDYCNVGEIPIVRVLNLDTFLAVISAGKAKKKATMVRYMDKSLMEKLRNNELTVEELLGEIYNWVPIQEVDAEFSKKEVNKMIEYAESQGHVVKKDVESREQGTGKNTKSKWLGLKKRKK